MNSKNKLNQKKQQKQKAKDFRLQKLNKVPIDPVPKEDEEEESDDGIDFLKQQESASDLDPVNFLFVEPNDAHYHSLKSILARYKTATSNKVPVLADYISKHKQFGVATVQEVDDDDSDAAFETVFSILTFIPLSVEDQFVKDMKKYFISSCEKYCKNKQTILQIINSKKCSFFMNDRYINLLPKLIPLQHETIQKDFKQFKKAQPKNKISTTQYLLGMSYATTESKKSKEKQTPSLSDLLMYNFQNSQILKYAQDFWVFPDDSKLFGKQASYNIHYVISVSKYFEAIPKLKILVSQ